MKKFLSVITLLLVAALLLCACAPASNQDATTGETDTSEKTDASENENREPDRYEYWFSDATELVFSIDKKSSVAKFYSLKSGYYAYFALHEGTYTSSGNTISIDIHDTTYVFTYNEEDDTYAIQNSVSDADDIIYVRKEEAPEAHPSYAFPNFEELDFISEPELGDYQKDFLKQAALEEAGIKIFLDYYSSSIDPYPVITDRPIKKGDYINISYIGYLNGTIIDGAGGSEEFFPVITFPENIDNVKRVDDFINGMVGHMSGETFEIEVNFPEDYSSEVVAGKKTIFEITVNAVYDVRLTDEQVQSYEDLEFDTYDAYLEGVAKATLYDIAIPYLVKSNQIADLLPAGAYMHFYQFYLDQAHEIAKLDYQMEYEKYLDYTGQSEERMLAESKQMAADFLLAYYIADQHNLEWTQDQYADQYELMVKEYLDNAINQDKAEELIGATRMEELYAELTYRIASDWMVALAFKK